MIEYSIIVPCYNEAENIPKLLSVFSDFMSDENAELIIVDNGSSDGTAGLEAEMKKQYPFLRWVHIEKNIGYGHGIYTGLSHAKGRYLGYTHADLQTDPYDVMKAISIINSIPDNDPVFVKGYRRGRKLIPRFFSKTFELMVFLILNSKFKEINAQPTFFSKELLTSLKKPPWHWGFDLYACYHAVKEKYTIKRFDVLFPCRRSGKSKWNVGFMSQINLSMKMIKYCFEIKKDENKISKENEVSAVKR